MEVISLCFMEEKELRSVLAENIKKYRNRRGWNQLLLSEKVGISANYLSAIETSKGWITALTLVNIAKALEIEVFELFKPVIPNVSTQTEYEFEKMKRFARDLTLEIKPRKIITVSLLRILCVCSCFIKSRSHSVNIAVKSREPP
jgi:transcriptional regulator with XRE-family HTH domain